MKKGKLIFTTLFVIMQMSASAQTDLDQYFYSTTSNQADIVVRVGDIDNFGFGWEEGFDPFCGMNTSGHSYPWEIDPIDHEGTDRIMVVSSYGNGYTDGYTDYTRRPENNPIGISIQYKKPEVPIEKIVLQMMLDDFQAPVWGTFFQFHINGKRLSYVEDIINQLNQTGPTGKLVQVGLLPEDNHLFASGELTIKIDDPKTGAGDGFAIDFIQLLINPKGDEYICAGNVTVLVKDEAGKVLDEVLVSANGLKEGITDLTGRLSLSAVPIGVLTVTANKSGYSTASLNFELDKEETKEVVLILKKNKSESMAYLNSELTSKGFVNLYGIHFESGKSVPTADSKPTLSELLKFVKANPELIMEIVGHTDSDGDEASNADLSMRRAEAVISYLSSNGANVSKIKGIGLGESSPIANNNTSSGKALNRRVEIRTSK